MTSTETIKEKEGEVQETLDSRFKVGALCWSSGGLQDSLYIEKEMALVEEKLLPHFS